MEFLSGVVGTAERMSTRPGPVRPRRQRLLLNRIDSRGINRPGTVSGVTDRMSEAVGSVSMSTWKPVGPWSFPPCTRNWYSVPLVSPVTV
eukprot:556934-Rhodomonas_salina.1